MDWRKFLFISQLAGLGCTPKPLSESIDEIDKPDNAEEWLQDNISYLSDQFNYGKEDLWASCNLTYQGKAGDCEDFAICAAALLQDDVEKGYLIDLTRGHGLPGHMIFAYQKNSRWNVFSDDHLYQTSSPTLSQLILDFDKLTKTDIFLYQPTYVAFKGFYVSDYSGVNLIHNNNIRKEVRVISHGTLEELGDYKSHNPRSKK